MFNFNIFPLQVSWIKHFFEILTDHWFVSPLFWGNFSENKQWTSRAYNLHIFSGWGDLRKKTHDDNKVQKLSSSGKGKVLKLNFLPAIEYQLQWTRSYFLFAFILDLKMDFKILSWKTNRKVTTIKKLEYTFDSRIQSWRPMVVFQKACSNRIAIAKCSVPK